MEKKSYTQLWNSKICPVYPVQIHKLRRKNNFKGQGFMEHVQRKRNEKMFENSIMLISWQICFIVHILVISCRKRKCSSVILAEGTAKDAFMECSVVYWTVYSHLWKGFSLCKSQNIMYIQSQKTWTALFFLVSCDRN